MCSPGRVCSFGLSQHQTSTVLGASPASGSSSIRSAQLLQCVTACDIQSPEVSLVSCFSRVCCWVPLQRHLSPCEHFSEYLSGLISSKSCCHGVTETFLSPVNHLCVLYTKVTISALEQGGKGLFLGMMFAPSNLIFLYSLDLSLLLTYQSLIAPISAIVNNSLYETLTFQITGFPVLIWLIS